MIRTLRRKFILVAMCSTFAVLAAIMAIIHLYSYTQVIEQADQLLAILADNEGEFPLDEPGDTPAEGGEVTNEAAASGKGPQEISPEGKEDGERQPGVLSPETPYETRFFSAFVDETGTVVETKTGNIAAVTEDEAGEYALEVWKQKKTGGFYGFYRYHISAETGGDRIIFVDCNRELRSFFSSLGISVGVSAVGLFLVLLLVIVFSRRIFSPVVESYEKQKQFITDASHELKTPLTIIDANTEVLEMTEGENEWTRSIRRQVKRLSAMTQQLVALSRMEEGGRTGVMADFSLSDAAEETAELFLPSAQAQGKSMELRIEPGIICHGDEGMIRQMISLLLDNALKYSSDEGKICVLLQKRGKKIQLQVTNAVDAVEKGSQDILFERFYRRDVSRNSDTGGSGIGLSVARAIVEAHGGKIHAESRDGKSIVFTATL